MKKKINLDFKWELHDLAIVIALLFLTLVIVYGLYTPFTLDDYQYATLFRDHGFLGALKERYLHWHGRFSSNFFILLYHALGNIPRGLNFSVLINTFFLLLTFGLFQSRLVHLKGKKRRILGILVLAVFAITASPFLHSLLYWWAGSATYHIGFFFAIFSLWCSDRMIRKTSMIYWPLNFIVMMIAAGMNEMNFIILILGNIFIGWGYYQRIDNIRWRQTALFNFFCIATAGLAVLMSPTAELKFDAAKLASSNDFGTSFLGALNFPYYTQINSTHIGLILIGTIAYLCLNPRLKLKVNSQHLITLFFIVLIAFICVHFAAYWSEGLSNYPHVVSPRISNILFLLLFFFLVIAGIKFFQEAQGHWKSFSAPRWANSLVLIFLLITALYQGNGRDILRGLEQEIPQTLFYLDKAIHGKLENVNVSDIHLSLPKKLLEQNKIFPLQQVYHSDPKYWFNQTLSKYYHGQNIAFSFNEEQEWLEILQEFAPEYFHHGHFIRFNKSN